MTSKAARSRGMPRRTAAPTKPSSSRLPLIIGGGLALVVIVAAIAAMVLTSSPGTSVNEPATRPIAVEGSALPELTAGGSDPAIGQPIPSLTGIGLDGKPMTISPDDGPMAIVVLAHWCPHCRNELPGLVDYLESGAAPEGVTIVGLSTAINPAQPNYPPSSWLEREGWTERTLVDDGSNTALNTLGIGSFPGFVFVDADGRVVSRQTGEIGPDAFGQMLEQLAG